MQHRKHLEVLVEERTVELSKINKSLEREIKVRKQAEETIRESEKRFRIFVDFTYDWESWIGPDGKYIYVTPSFERTTGYPPDELLKDHRFVETIIHPEDRKNFSMHRHNHSNRDEVLSHDFRIITRNGNTRWISHICQPVYDSDGSWLGRRASNRDITEQKKLEEQFRQAQKMEAIGRLSGGMAHDFNNLLTTILGYGELMLDDIPDNDPSREFAEEIIKAGNSAASLISQLLAFSRSQVFELEFFDLNAEIIDLKKMLQRLIGEDVRLDTFLTPRLGKIKADRVQIQQVIMNLAVNARDAMPQGGKLTIETTNVDLDESYAQEHDVKLKPGPYVMLSMSDTGIGMDKETQSKIFEPFFTTKAKGKGTGLGLATVYGIIKQSDGYIWVYSEIGKGTTFKIYMPAVQEEAVSKKEKQIFSEQLRGTETVLLVEDEQYVRNLLVMVLKQYGYTVHEAKDGEAALNHCAQYKDRIHLMVTDVVMPGMSGRELADRLKTLRPEMKILFMSGYTDDAIVNHGILESDVHFIQKPISPKALARKVQEVLGSKEKGVYLLDLSAVKTL